jgi:hypothetical protein
VTRQAFVAIVASCIVASPSVGAGSRQRSRQATQLTTVGDLSKHIGEYPCRSGLLDDAVLQRALREVLADDYGAFLEHMRISGCGAVAWRGSSLLLDISELHVGGYTSFIMVNPQSAGIWVFWLPGTVKEQNWKLYGQRPIPTEISKVIVDELNSIWGHVASFSWREGVLTFGPPRFDVRPSERPQPAALALSSR